MSRKLFEMLTGLVLLIAAAGIPAQQLQVPGHVEDFDGPTHIAVFLVYYQDTDPQQHPAREFDSAAIAEIQSDLFGPEPSVADLFDEMSFGTDSLTGTIIQVPTPIPFNGHTGGSCGYGAHTSWAGAVLEQLDPDGTIYSYQGSGGYDMLMFIYPRGNNCDGPYGGVNGIVKRTADGNPNPDPYDPLPYTSIFNWKVEQTFAHELGHLKGWNHAELEGYTGYQQGYGDHSCLMGDNYTYPNHPDYPIVVPNPGDPPLAQRLELRQASAPLKIRAGYIDPSDVYFSPPSATAQTVYLAPTERDPANFPSPPGGAPIHHAAAIDFQFVDRSYVVSFRHQSLSPYNLDYPHLMGRVHVHTFGDTLDIVRRANLEAGQTYTDDFLTVTAMSDGLNGEDYVEVQITVPEYFPAGVDFEPFVEESNDAGDDSQVIPIVVKNRGPSGTGSVTFDLSLNALTAGLSGATFTPSQVTLVNPGDWQTVDMELNFDASPLSENEYDYEVVVSDAASLRADSVGAGVYFNDTSGPVIGNLIADHQAEQVVLTWTSDRPYGDTFEITRGSVEIVAPGLGFTSYTDTDVDPGSTHTYCVRGTDHLGNVGNWECKTASDPCTVAPTVSVDPETVAVTQPSGSGTVGTFAVSITNNNPGSCDPFHYSVQAPANPQPNWNLLGGGVTVAPGATETTSLIVAYFNPQNPFEAPNQAWFDFEVGASDPYGTSGSGPEVTFVYDLTDPVAPQSALACLGSGEVALSWSGASDNLVVSHYEIHDSGGLIGTSTGTAFTDESPDLQDLNYQIFTVDRAGRTSTAKAVSTSAPTLTMNLLEASPTNDASPAFSVTVQNNNSPACPGTTFGLSSVDGAGFTVSVDPSLTIAGGASDDADGTVNSSQDGTHAFQVDVDGQPVGGTYVVDTVAPTKPKKLFGGQGPGTAFFSWNPSKDPGGTGVVGYRIDRNGNYLATVTGTAYQDNNPPGSWPRTYSVRGIDAAGNLSAAASITFSSPPF